MERPEGAENRSAPPGRENNASYCSPRSQETHKQELHRGSRGRKEGAASLLWLPSASKGASSAWESREGGEPPGRLAGAAPSPEQPPPLAALRVSFRLGQAPLACPANGTCPCLSQVFGLSGNRKRHLRPLRDVGERSAQAQSRHWECLGPHRGLGGSGYRWQDARGNLLPMSLSALLPLPRDPHGATGVAQQVSC